MVKAPGSKSLSKVAIARIVVGVAALVAALSVFAFVWFTRKKWSKVPQKSFGKLRYFFSTAGLQTENMESRRSVVEML